MSIALLIAAAAAGVCPVTEVAGAPGENHVMFHGLSPDGRTLAVGWDREAKGATERGAYLLDLRTHRKSELPTLNNAPSFSPSGRFLVSANYAADPSLRTEIVEFDRRNGTSRTYASGASAEWLASYSPDGRSILFNSTRSGASDLYRFKREEGLLDRLTRDPRYEAHGQYVDGGRRVIFHRQTDGDNYDIVIRDLKTRGEWLVGATPAEEAYPAMSPNGRWIALSAVPTPGSLPNLYLMRRDGSARVRLTETPMKDAYATWSPDGRSLLFVRFGPGGSKIYRMDVEDGRCRHRQ